MLPFNQPSIPHPCPQSQRGGVLMVMLVIMIIGAATLLVSSLNSSSIKIARDKTTANALAQAKDALIGRALTDDNRPGSLPCPDTNDDGSSELLTGNECPSYTGRLPWRTLGLPDLRDGAGERVWYALSQNFHDDDSIRINSETQGRLAISGSNPASQIIAIVFAPGPVLNGASRSPITTATCPSLSGAIKAQNLCATNYLEGSNAALNASSVSATLNLNYQSADTSTTFNDRMILITHKDLMPLVEKRIAREVKSCLDNYTLANSNKYPWAAPVGSTTYTGTTGTLFGKLPKFNPNQPTVQQLFDDLAALQLALNNYSTDPGNTTKITLLQTAGSTLQADALTQTPATATPLDQSSLNQAANAGESAQSPHTPAANATAHNVANFVTTVQGQIDQAYSFFASPQHGNVTPGWSSSCKVFTSYWNDSHNISIWRDLVFYQIADGYKPGGSGSCGSSCLTINGSGNTAGNNGTYHAAVIVAGEMLPGQSPRSPTANPPYNYLANTASEKSSDPTFAPNAHDSTSATPATTFITHKPTDTYYQSVNDLVLCLDGGVNCK